MKVPQMWTLVSAVFFLTVAASHKHKTRTPTQTSNCFPKDFMFGVATASYQIEGAWNEGGKSESIWDRYTHTHPERVFDHSNGDVTDDSYHRMQDDLRILGELNVQFYRFSISWPRVLPDGFSNAINEDGVKYYMQLIDALHSQGIEPLITMYHWDLPQSLQDLGGWTNPMMADYFVDYAKVLFQTFGDKVKHWITFNEPLTFCEDGYGGSDAPGGLSSGLEDYMCGHNVLRAHGMAYRMYEREFRKKGDGTSIGITLDFCWEEPATTSPGDEEAAETARQFSFGWFAHPIFSTEGDYPQVMRQNIDENSRKQNFPRSRLPRFTEEEVAMIRGSADFLGLNHYTTRLVSKIDHYNISMTPSFYEDIGVQSIQKPEWPKSNSTWLRVVPWGFRKALRWVKNSYNNPIVVVTENGVSTQPGLKDTKRVNYISGYMKAMLDAITIDHCNVIGYTHWSLMDNFEWMRGLSERFGLYEVDYESPERARTPRLSAHYYATIAKTRCMPDSWSTWWKHALDRVTKPLKT